MKTWATAPRLKTVVQGAQQRFRAIRNQAKALDATSRDTKAENVA